MLTLESVFVTDAYPKYTYVAAEEGRIEKELNEGLDIKNKILSLVGPSKCGKTTLCDRVFGTEKGKHKLLATGDSFDSADQFWLNLYEQLDLPNNILGEFQFASRDQMMRAVAESQLPVIIDDFHYIDSEVQRRLCQQMKNAAAQGIRFIVLNPPQRLDDPIRNNPDLAGRFYSINVNFWEKADCARLASKDFKSSALKYPKTS